MQIVYWLFYGSLLTYEQTRYIFGTFIKHLHKVLKTETSDSRKDWFAVGEYKKLPSKVGEKKTAEPAQVSEKIKQLYRTVYH